MTAVAYQLHLAPAILTGEQPAFVATKYRRSTCAASILPSNWPALPCAKHSRATSSTFDVLFSPQGTVIGPPASSGRIHFVLADIADTTGETYNTSFSNRFQLNAPWEPATAYAVGNVIVPTPSSSIAFRCTTAGTTGAAATQPSWPDQPNVTVNDANGIVWQSFVKKANLIVSLATATGRVSTHPVDVFTLLGRRPATTRSGSPRSAR